MLSTKNTKQLDMKKLLCLILSLLLIMGNVISVYAVTTVDMETYIAQSNYNVALERLNIQSKQLNSCGVLEIEDKKVYTNLIDKNTYVVASKDGYAISKKEGNKIFLTSKIDGEYETVEINIDEVKSAVEKNIIVGNHATFNSNSSVITPNSEVLSLKGYYKYREFIGGNSYRQYTLTVPKYFSKKSDTKTKGTNLAERQNYEITARSFCKNVDKALNYSDTMVDNLESAMRGKLVGSMVSLLTKVKGTILICTDISAQSDIKGFLAGTMSMVAQYCGEQTAAFYNSVESGLKVYAQSSAFISYRRCLSQAMDDFKPFKSQI
nr:hypothetical protein [Sedimentibacter sp.]